MRTKRLLAVVAVLAIGCTEPDKREFVIRADSVIVPGAWPGGVPLTARVYAHIGPNLCWAFKEFRVQRDPLGAKVTIVGANTSGPNAGCRSMEARMEGEELILDPPLYDPFELRIMQPDGTTLSKTIRTE